LVGRIVFGDYRRFIVFGNRCLAIAFPLEEDRLEWASSSGAPIAFAAGVRFGPYEILSAVGAGGMGEVYKARDTRLDRIVALKILPDVLATDPHFRDRFDREARSISQLDHPHICALYDVGNQGGTAYLVMQYLEGETLADRVAKGALPIDHALQIAIQIADALVAAHKAGIVHRDLKPGNIMLSKSGAKLLDFGLARTGAAVVGAPSQSIPTVAPLTQPGSILGTFQYMAPEQLEGQDADARTDIFAFGVVVYEMVTGRKAFAGKTSASLIGAILKDQPSSLSTVQPVTPGALDWTVRRCLAKEPDARWQSARDLLEELRWIAAEGQRHAPADTTRVRRRARATGLVAATALIVAIPTIMATRYLRPAESLVTRLDLVTPPAADPFSFALSPDGRQMAFVTTADGISRLWVRSLDSGNARPFPGSEGASYPFWKPDGGAIGFFAQDKLKVVDAAGGVPLELTKVPGARGGTWNQDGVIVFAPQLGGLMRVTATGGTAPVALTHAAPGQSHRWPQFLPDGRHFLFLSTLGQPSTHGAYLGSLDGREPKRLLTGETAAVYAPPGYLLRVVEGVLVAHRFNPDSGVVNSESVPLAQPVGTDDGTFHSAFSVSPGTLAYRAGGTARRQLVWLDRKGNVTGTVGPPDDSSLASPEMAPSGRRIAVNRLVQGRVDIFIVESDGGRRTQFTIDPTQARLAVWSPEAGRIVFSSNRNGVFDLFQKVASGASNEQPLLVTPQNKLASDWSPDGRFLLYASDDPTTGSDLWAWSFSDRKSFPVVQTSADEREGQFSPPDGRWVAYVSNERSGIDQVFIQPFPGPGGKWQVSTNGGADPRWGRDGRELFYVAPDGKLMAAEIHVDADGRALTPEPPNPLFQTRLATGANVTVGFLSRPQYAVAPDGRFLMNVTADDNVVSPISIVLNWATALKK
jgi:Tol biopolymer transport system component